MVLSQPFAKPTGLDKTVVKTGITPGNSAAIDLTSGGQIAAENHKNLAGLIMPGPCGGLRNLRAKNSRSQLKIPVYSHLEKTVVFSAMDKV